jgi:hypothetical protein
VVAAREAAHAVPEREVAHEENEWNIELVGAEQHEKESPIEFESVSETVDVSALAVSEMIARLEASQG